jgi:hypothetical protein
MEFISSRPTHAHQESHQLSSAKHAMFFSVTAQHRSMTEQQSENHHFTNSIVMGSIVKRFATDGKTV